MTRVQIDGFTTDARTRDMLVAARVVCRAPLVITQGSYNGGGVAASAGTHDGGGALDLRATNLTSAQRLEAVGILRKVGFAAWLRTPSQGDWPYHIHAIAKGCPDLSRGASGQVTAYLAGRNGLASKGPDDGPRTYVNWTWEKYKSTYPDLLTEDELSAADVKEIKDYMAAVSTQLQLNAAQHKRALRQEILAALDANQNQQTEQLTTYVRQLDAADDAEIAGLKAQLTALGVDVDSVQTELAQVEAKVDALDDEPVVEAPKA